MRNVIPSLGAVLCAAAFVLPTTAHAVRATECTAINICYCVEQDLKGAIDTNVSKVRQAIAEQKSAGKAIGYLSIPISTVGGAYFGVNIDVAAKTKAAVEKRFGETSLWILNPGDSRFSLPSGANGADYMYGSMCSTRMHRRAPRRGSICSASCCCCCPSASRSSGSPCPM